MNKYFSPSALGFYIEGINKNIPNDAITVSDEVYQQFAGAAWPEGKVIGADDTGGPVWVDAPPKSPEELIAEAESQKAQLRTAADSEIIWRQDAVDTGIATEEETAALVEWKKYRVLLMRIDTTAPVWPTTPGQQAS